MTSSIDINAFVAYARNELGITDVPWLQAALNAGQAQIEQMCQRSFTVAGASATARLYAATPGSSVLRIHDCTTVTAVSEAGAAVASTLYQKEPVNLIDWAGVARPYEQLRKLNSTWSTDGGEAIISVTGTWGWSAIPASVTEAIYIQAKDIASQRDVRAGVAAFGDFGAIRVRANPTVETLIAPFRRIEAFGIA